VRLSAKGVSGAGWHSGDEQHCCCGSNGNCSSRCSFLRSVLMCESALDALGWVLFAAQHNGRRLPANAEIRASGMSTSVQRSCFLVPNRCACIDRAGSTLQLMSLSHTQLLDGWVLGVETQPVGWLLDGWVLRPLGTARCCRCPCQVLHRPQDGLAEQSFICRTA
jgi:hypothetical protein